MSTEKLYHYVYIITNVIENKYYIGCRSCNILPEKDLGIKYFSSSKDKKFVQDQKTNPQHYKYKVIAIFDNRVSAISLEIKLHYIHDVGVNSKFYNKAKQTVTGWDMTGVSKACSEETKAKISAANKGRLVSEEAKIKMSKSAKGRKHTEEARAKMSAASKARLATGNIKKHTEETKAKISAANKGRKPSQNAINANIKPVNIYEAGTDKLIAENVVMAWWVIGTKYRKNCLSATARADRAKPNSSKNRHYCKDIYARYI